MKLALALLPGSLLTSCAAFTASSFHYQSQWKVVDQFNSRTDVRKAKWKRNVSGIRTNLCQFRQYRTTRCYAGKTNEEKKATLEKDIEAKLTFDDRTYENFGPLRPIAESIDGMSGDWALSYADLSPATPKTVAGRAFLATNACYAIAGLALGINGDWFFGALTEIAGAVSFWYHYSQLDFGKDRSEVRLALLVDYFTAGAALITGGFYMVDMGFTMVPFDALAVGTGAVISLSLCWVWEVSTPIS